MVLLTYIFNSPLWIGLGYARTGGHSSGYAIMHTHVPLWSQSLITIHATVHKKYITQA